MGFVIYGWCLSIFIRDVFHDATSVYRSPYLTNPTHIWQTPPHMTNPTQIWQTPPIYDKPHCEFFCKANPLRIFKSRNWALWLVEKGSHDQNRALSLVEKTACVFPYPPRSRGVCHIWVGFVKSGILPIYDKPWWQIPYNNYSRRISSRYLSVRGPYLTNTDKPKQPLPI